MVAAVGYRGLDFEGGEEDVDRLVDQRGVGGELFGCYLGLMGGVGSSCGRAGFDGAFTGIQFLALGVAAPGVVGFAVEVV